MERPDNPAKFNDAILELLDRVVPYGDGFDPFVGVGRIYEITNPRREILGIEIEKEWAEQGSGRTICANFLEWGEDLVLNSDVRFDFCVTSPTYGNRMADHHDAQEKCRACDGTGSVTKLGGHDEWSAETYDAVCGKCNGVGRREHVRNTYRHKLGRPLSEGSSAGMQWGEGYREFHSKAWELVYGLLRHNGVFILNMKDHYRQQTIEGKRISVRQMVTEWHVREALNQGFELYGWKTVDVPGNRFGANSALRVEYESVLLFVKNEF